MQFIKTTKLITIKKLANKISIINVKDFEKVMKTGKLISLRKLILLITNSTVLGKRNLVLKFKIP